MQKQKITRVELREIVACDKSYSRLVQGSYELSNEGYLCTKRLLKNCLRLIADYEKEKEKRERIREKEKYGSCL